jgi:hypothetical protein
MNALTAVAATAYAIALWMFAPESFWRREVEQAKRNQNQLNPPPEMTPQPKPEPMVIPKMELKSTQKAIPESIPQLDIIPEVTSKTESIPEAIEQAISTLHGTDYTEWTTAKLRDEAKTRKLNWRPLVDGKRKPLNKPQLIQLLKT